MKKKAVLLGDSIRLMGYGKRAAELLADEYTVFQPNENCRYVKFTLRLLFDLREEIAGADVIHWNNGLWDTSTGLFDDGGKPFTCEEEYVDNMLRIASELLKITPNVIFATTTPVHPDYPYNNNDVIVRYNEVLVPKLAAMGIKINDLHSIIAPDIENNICQDQIHLSETGAQMCAQQVVRMIKEF